MTNLLRKIAAEVRQVAYVPRQSGSVQPKQKDNPIGDLLTMGMSDLLSPRSRIVAAVKKYGPAAIDGVNTFTKTRELTDKIAKLPVYMRPKMQSKPERAKIWMNLSSDQRRQAYDAVTGLTKSVDAINGASFLKKPIVAAEHKSAIDAHKKTLNTLGLL